MNSNLKVTMCFPFSYTGQNLDLKWETWNRRLDALEMCLYHRIQTVSWLDPVTNIDNLHRIIKKTKKKYSHSRKLYYLSNIVWNSNLCGTLQNILQGKFYEDVVQEYHMFPVSITELFRVVANKIMIAMVAANIRKFKNKKNSIFTSTK